MNTNTVIQHAQQHCEHRGYRLTTKREQVLLILLESNKALSAYGLIDMCEQQFGCRVPAMSMYRILDFLESVQLVHKVHLANKYIASSAATVEQLFGVPQIMICEICHKVEEITISPSITDELSNNVTTAGFSLIKPHLEMNCVCNDCISEMLKSKSKSKSKKVRTK